MNYIQLGRIMRKAWSADTCYPHLRDKWSEELPELGQCAVTALVVQHMCGGKIAYNKKYNHYWNVLPNEKEWDLTRAQFPDVDEIPIDCFRKVSDPSTRLRASLLKLRVEAIAKACKIN